MTRIAHLSDLHLLEDDHRERVAAGRLRLSYLSFGRKLDAAERRARLRTQLWAYRNSAAEHLVITGDLTEDGCPAQFEVLAEVLFESGIDPREITLVPGNHDAYCTQSAFADALAGPLAAYRKTSAAGAVSVFDEIAIVAVSTAIAQPVTRSAGWIDCAQLEHIERLAARFKPSGRALALAQHHPPFVHAVPGMHWIDGLQNHSAATAVLERHRALHVLHGHRHRVSDRSPTGAGRARVFGATACVSDEAPLRVYEARDGRLWPLAVPGLPRRPNATADRGVLNPAWTN